MTQSPIPLIEASLAFDLKPEEVEFIRKQKAGGRETEKDAEVGGVLADGAGKRDGYGGGSSLAGHQVVTAAPQPLVVVRATSRL